MGSSGQVGEKDGLKILKLGVVGVYFRKSSGLMMCSDSIMILKVLGKTMVALLGWVLVTLSKVAGCGDFVKNGLRDSLRLRLILWLRRVKC